MVQSTKAEAGDRSPPNVSLSFTNPTTAGDTIIVAIGWYDLEHSIASVTDTQGNAYKIAVGPTQADPGGENEMQQVIYYAANVVGGTTPDSIQVTWTGPADGPDLRAIDVSGLNKTSPFIAGAQNTNHGNAATAGPVTTTASPALLFGAGMTSDGFDQCATGYSTCIITNEDGNVGEAEVITSAAGPQSITTPLADNGLWIMQLAAFQQ